ncbi:hypothetical protein BKA81DRAFT_349826 [Phyllosticta paracitricarpa]
MVKLTRSIIVRATTPLLRYTTTLPSMIQSSTSTLTAPSRPPPCPATAQTLESVIPRVRTTAPLQLRHSMKSLMVLP